MTEMEDKPVIMSTKVAKMIQHHINKEKIIYILEDTTDEIVYMLKSILRDSMTYDIVFNKQYESYRCSCPAYKFKKRLSIPTCKHVEFLLELISSEVKIDSM